MARKTKRSEPADRGSGPRAGVTANLSRRDVLLAGTMGAAAVGTVAAFPALVGELAGGGGNDPSKAPATSGDAAARSAALDGPIVAHIRDASTGEFSLFVGEREIEYRDLGLVQQLTRLAH